MVSYFNIKLSITIKGLIYELTKCSHYLQHLIHLSFCPCMGRGGEPQSLVPSPFTIFWFQVFFWERKGEGVPQTLIPGPFLDGRRGRYPILWSQVLFQGEGIPRSGAGTEVPLSLPIRRYPLSPPLPLASTRRGVPPPPDSTCHGQDAQRAVHFLRLSRRTFLFLSELNEKYIILLK